MRTANVKHYCDVWDLSNPNLLATTPTSDVYRVEREKQPLVLKVFTPLGEEDEGSGSVALEYFSGEGAVRLRGHDRGAQLLEYVNGYDLLSLVRDGRDQEATEILGDVLNKLHSIPSLPPKNLGSLHDRFASLREKAANDARSGLMSVYTSGAAVAETLLANQRDVRVLHGDIHHENLLYSRERGWLAIDPKGLVGERTYDAANALLNPIALPDVVADSRRFTRHAELLAAKMQLDLERLVAFTFAHACLSACWSLEDGEDPGLALIVANRIRQEGGVHFTGRLQT